MDDKPSHNRHRTQASYAHENPDLRRDNPLYERAGSARSQFERNDPERAARRDAFMVERQQPRPVLRPSLSLSSEPDRASFNMQWNDERRAALRDARNLREDLLNARSQIHEHDRQRKQAEASGSMRDLTQTERDVERLLRRTTARVRSFTRAHGKF